MSVQQVAQAHYLTQKLLQAATLQQVLGAWRQIDPSNVAGSWQKTVGGLVYAQVAAGQALAASLADSYVNQALSQQGVVAAPEGAVVARAFSGTASDGRDLAALLFETVIAVRAGFGAGLPLADSLLRGQRALTMYVQTQVADAGRTAVGAAITARPEVTGWVRMLTLPACSRCAVLAGRWYQWDQGFERHPFCDCRHIPASEAASGDLRLDARAAIEARQVTGLSEADTKAIVEDGADPGQVINARRSLYTADVYGRKVSATREGTTARGAAAKMLTQQGGSYTRTPRLRPEEIYRQATDRTDAIRMLRRFGYIT